MYPITASNGLAYTPEITFNETTFTLKVGCHTASFNGDKKLGLPYPIQCSICQKYAAVRSKTLSTFISIDDPGLSITIRNTDLIPPAPADGMHVTTDGRAYFSHHAEVPLYIIYTGDINLLTPDDLKRMQTAYNSARTKDRFFDFDHKNGPDFYNSKSLTIKRASSLR